MLVIRNFGVGRSRRSSEEEEEEEEMGSQEEEEEMGSQEEEEEEELCWIWCAKLTILVALRQAGSPVNCNCN